jgi:hypothetical protein
VKVAFFNGRQNGRNGVATWLREVQVVLQRRGDVVVSLSAADVVVATGARTATDAATLTLGRGQRLVTMLHGPLSPKWHCTTLLERADRIVATNRTWAEAIGFECVELPYLPYTRRHPTPVQLEPVVVMTSRVTNTKGQTALAAVLRDVPLYLAGEPGFSWGKVLWWWLHTGRDRPLGQSWRGRPPYSQLAVPPWTVENVTYLGPYDDPFEVFTQTRAAVHVNLTSEGYNSGHLEYVTLEALDAGLRCVVPEHQVRGLAYPPGTVLSVPYTRPATADYPALRDAVHTAFTGPRPPLLDIWALHDPTLYVAGLLGQPPAAQGRAASGA